MGLVEWYASFVYEHSCEIIFNLDLSFRSRNGKAYAQHTPDKDLSQ